MSKPPGPAPGSPAAAAGGASHYTRFIPREELGNFSAWNPGSLEDSAARKPAPGQSPAGGGVHKPSFAERAGVHGAVPGQGPDAAHPPRPSSAPQGKSPSAPKSGPVRAAPEAAPPAPPAPDLAALTQEARQAGYQDGYRDGLAAMESFKHAQTAQMAAFMSERLGALVNDLHARLEALETQLSGRVAGVALELARQVVRSEISQRPELVVTVAEEALGTLLGSARDVTLNMHPDDYALARGALTEQLASRGARVMADTHVSPGGCVVSSDIAVVDARVEARWLRAAAAMGMHNAWGDDVPLPLPLANADADDSEPGSPGLEAAP